MRNVVIYTLMFSAMLQLLMAAYAWGRRNEPAAKPLLLVFALGAVWAFAYGMDMASGNISIKIFWTQIYWSAAAFGPLVYLLIVFEHLELTHLLTRGRLAFLLIPPLLIIALVWTIPYHDLLLYDFFVERIGPLDVLLKKNGVLYIPIFLALQGVSIVSYYYLIRSFSSTSLIKRRQSAVILFALVVPFIVNIPAILNVSPIKDFDFTPHSLVISSALFAFAIFRYRLLDIIPLARNALVETLPVGVVVLDSKYRIVDINPSAQTFLQIDDSVIGRDSQDALPHLDPVFHGHFDDGLMNKEISLDHPSGTPKFVDAHVIPLQDREGKSNGWIITLSDVTERRQVNERLQAQLDQIASLHNQLHEQAIRDPLTGVFNRRYMNDAMERETLRAGRHEYPLSLLMVEIDNFKRVNDTFGHDAGDFILQQIAGLIQTSIRADDIPCRFGGDEFVLMFPVTPVEAARQCGERILQGVSDLRVDYEGKSIGGLTLSIGVAAFPKDGNTALLALRAADEAMYRAKQTGKNRVVVAGG